MLLDILVHVDANSDAGVVDVVDTLLLLLVAVWYLGYRFRG